MKNVKLRLLDGKNKIINKSHPEFDSGSSTHSVAFNDNNMRGRFQIKFGMTSCNHTTGFTRIELLVVVLIIGILAEGTPGYFCQKIFGAGDLATDERNTRFYSMY